MSTHTNRSFTTACADAFAAYLQLRATNPSPYRASIRMVLNLNSSAPPANPT